MSLPIPEPTRPLMSGDYGLSEDRDGMLSWEWVEEQLIGARNYWISSTRPNGKPHAAPVWGIWMADALYFGTDRRSVKGRNLAYQPALHIHLESGDRVVMIEGTAVEVVEVTVLKPFYEAYAIKYDFDPSTNPTEDGIYYAVKPEVALAWLENDFVNTAARWDFRDRG